ncbi:MAG: glycosyltransferase [Bacteroidetes bacterium]|nr:glycosyltransferase [Bacteroidota bacterium]
MCNSSSKDFNVGLLCHDADKVLDDGFKKYNLGKKPSSFIQRILIQVPKTFFQILRIKPKIVHLHDPELFIFTLILRFFNISTVIDLHEDYWSTINDKPYLHPLLKSPIAFLTKIILNISCKNANEIIVAWPKIGDNLKAKFTVINNYPNISVYPNNIIKKHDSINFIFSGVISFERGFKEALLFFEEFHSEVPKKFILVGRFNSELEKNYFSHKYSTDARFEYFEWIDQNSLMKLMIESHLGFIFFHDLPNHRYSVPNKLFEYIACGVIPLVSDLPFLSKFVKTHKCGISSDIFDIQNYVLETKKFIEENSDLQVLFSNVKKQYSWEIEYSKLRKLYQDIL